MTNTATKPTDFSLRAAKDFLAGKSVYDAPSCNLNDYEVAYTVFDSLVNLDHEPMRVEIQEISDKTRTSKATVQRLWHSLRSCGYELGTGVNSPAASKPKAVEFHAVHFMHKPGVLTCSRLRDIMHGVHV